MQELVNDESRKHRHYAPRAFRGKKGKGAGGGAEIEERKKRADPRGHVSGIRCYAVATNSECSGVLVVLVLVLVLVLQPSDQRGSSDENPHLAGAAPIEKLGTGALPTSVDVVGLM